MNPKTSTIFLSGVHPKTFIFKPLSKDFKVFSDKDCNAYLNKWGLAPNLKLLAYEFEEDFEENAVERFIKDIFLNDALLHDLNFSELKNDSDSIQHSQITIKIENVPCTKISFAMFSKIKEYDITLEDGTIRKCFEDYFDDFIISDELQKLLLHEESDNYDVFSDSERDEFIFRIFKHLCLGGILNQYEDNIEAYFKLTKVLYKDLISARKPKKGELTDCNIKSHVFKVTCYKNKTPIYPSSRIHEQDFLYVIVDPIDMHLFIFLHKRE